MARHGDGVVSVFYHAPVALSVKADWFVFAQTRVAVLARRRHHPRADAAVAVGRDVLAVY